MLRQTRIMGVIIIVVLAVGILGCGQAQQPAPGQKGSNSNAPAPQTSQAPKNEQPLAPEKNPVGDIPDSQVFIGYLSPAGGYSLKVPEGWARTEKGSDVSFVDKFNGVQVALTHANTLPTLESVQKNQVTNLKNNGKAVEIKSVKPVSTAGGQAFLIAYSSNSEKDAVTGKQVRVENNSFIFYKNGKLATLRLWAPLGADNVDQWELISNSFRWQ